MNFALLRRLVNETLESITAGERADRALARTLRANRGLSSEERARVARWTLGISLWRGRLDAMGQGDRSLWLGLFLADREKCAVDVAAEISGTGISVLQHALAVPPPREPAERLAFERSLPLWMAQRWISLWGTDRADRLAAAMNEPGPIALRANLLRSSRDGLLDQLAAEGVQARPSGLVPTGVIASGRPNILGLRAWREGLFEVQDEGSQFIAEAVHAQPGELVVDLCAGSGGKTLALAAQMRDRGHIVAVDVDSQRLVDLRVRAKRAGISCIETRAGDARDIALTSDLFERADAVLIDAPCSSIGTLRRGPDARWRINPDDAGRCALLQVALLHVGASLVRPGGRLLYATCSLEPTENEEVSRSLVASDFTLSGARTLAPDVEGCDGFFYALFARERRS